MRTTGGSINWNTYYITEYDFLKIKNRARYVVQSECLSYVFSPEFNTWDNTTPSAPKMMKNRAFYDLAIVSGYLYKGDKNIDSKVTCTP